jgi:outer membrane protein OmpA-like peptidoglycan-associated protein
MQPTAMTEGQRLGESLTEETDFQELTTDKFTEKKTGLQKQIENAENAFRAYQGDEIANQVQSYIPPEETLKIKQELGFDEKMSNVGSNFVNRLERFAPNTALAVGQTLTTLLGEDYGGEAYRMITGGVGNAEIHRMEAFDKLAKLDAAIIELNKYPNISLEIIGNTDNTGPKKINQKLSEKRAAVVFAYLVKKGIEEKRLIKQGVADTKPVSTNTTAKGRAENRRTDLNAKY